MLENLNDFQLIEISTCGVEDQFLASINTHADTEEEIHHQGNARATKKERN
jgi:hypothetical protein